MEQKVEISKSEYALDLLARFNHFRKTNKHCDFIIRAGKKEMPVHKFVVSASSEYFEAMLSHDTIENKQGLVEIKQVDPECIVKCVDFMYTGEASVSNEKQRDLMHVAHMLRLERLYNGIAVFLEKKLDCSTFFSTKEIANLYDCKQLVKHCNKFAMKNFRAIARFDDFKKLEVEYVKFLLSSKELEETDAIKCKALMVWINYDSGRAASLFDLLKQIDFSKVPIRYRRFLTEHEPSVGNSNDCLKLVMKSVFNSIDSTSADMTLEDIPGIIVLDSNSKRLKCFDLSEEIWSDMKEMHPNTVNKCSSVVTWNGFIYVFTGDQTTYRLNYRTSLAQWEQMTNRDGNWGLAVVFNGNVYCTEYGSHSNRIERYDCDRDQWSFIPNRTASLNGSAIVVSEDHLFLIGGCSSKNASVNTVEKFHPATSSWCNAPSLQQARHYASATSLHGAVYLFGGYFSASSKHPYYGGMPAVDLYRDRNRYTESLEILDCDGASWQLVNLNGFTRQSLSSHTIDGKIYLVGNNNSNFKTIEEFEPNAKTLKSVGTLTDMSLPQLSSVAAMK